MDIEKSSGHRKAQMLAALKAEKQRHAAKADYRRKRFTEALEKHFKREAEVLKEKHDVHSRYICYYTFRVSALGLVSISRCNPFLRLQFGELSEHQHTSKRSP